jgi:hypothetical protein
MHVGFIEIAKSTCDAYSNPAVDRRGRCEFEGRPAGVQLMLRTENIVGPRCAPLGTGLELSNKFLVPFQGGHVSVAAYADHLVSAHEAGIYLSRIAG